MGNIAGLKRLCIKIVHLYLILKIKMMITKIKEKAFARITGKELIRIPYTSQSNIPILNEINIIKEISFVCFVLTIFNT